MAQAIGSKTSPSVSAHIAAARRAAQAAFWEGAPAKDGGARPPAARGVQRAKSLYANHRRSVLLGFALAIVVTVAARLVSAPPIVRKSDADRPNAAATGLSLGKPAALHCRDRPGSTTIGHDPDRLDRFRLRARENQHSERSVARRPAGDGPRRSVAVPARRRPRGLARGAVRTRAAALRRPRASPGPASRGGVVRTGRLLRPGAGAVQDRSAVSKGRRGWA